MDVSALSTGGSAIKYCHDKICVLRGSKSIKHRVFCAKKATHEYIFLVRREALLVISAHIATRLLKQTDASINCLSHDYKTPLSGTGDSQMKPKNSTKGLN
eukprot:15364521-Ditylum_brightwellii.AAC.2